MVYRQHEIERGAAAALSHLGGGSRRDRRRKRWPSPRQVRTEDTAPAPLEAGKGKAPASVAGHRVDCAPGSGLGGDRRTSLEAGAECGLAFTRLLVLVVSQGLVCGWIDPCRRPGRLWGPGRARKRGLRNRDRLPHGRLAASHVFASLKRLAQGSAPGPRGGLRCAHPAHKPHAGEGVA